MNKKILFFIALALFLNACASKQNTFTQVNQLSKASQCVPCESSSGFEAKIKDLLYVSDIGIQCCANKRTLDTGVALKKVYLHRFYDLKEEQKARGIIVLDDNKANSPYVTKIDLAFTGYSAKQDSLGLHSRLVGVLSLSDINKNKKFTLRTKQDVQGFENLKDISFYTHLLIKQMANKAASIISEL